MSNATSATAPPTDNPIAFLRYLHARRYSDREIAEYLNDPPSFLLHEHRHVENPLHLLEKRDPIEKWTAYKVWYWRNYKLRGEDGKPLKGHRSARREIRRPEQAYALNRQIYALRWRELGLDLYPAQVDILDTLLAAGPLTMHAIAELLQRPRWPRLPGGKSAIALLVKAGAVQVVGSSYRDGKQYRLYAINPTVRPRHKPRRLTTIDQQFVNLGLIEDKRGRLPSPDTTSTTSDSEKFFGQEGEV